MRKEEGGEERESRPEVTSRGQLQKKAEEK